jgi:tRNA (adenine-N(1)-)-methyltransferase non-catalytic subunit
MRAEGREGQEIIRALVQGSSSFKDRTSFSQEKYLRRKQKKHLPYIELLRPSVPAVLRAYELRNPQRVGFLREDSLAHMLTLSNVQSGMRVLCLDQSGGLLAAAVLERLGPSGLLLLAHTQEQPPPLPLLRHFNALPLERLRRVSLHEVLAGREADAPACSLEAVLGQLGGLEACALLSALEPLMAPSAALALFSPFPEALRDAYERLLRSGGWVRVQLHETWLRAYQVLPDRTHPHMQMHGASGFLLTALRVLPAPLAVPTPTPAPALLSPEAVPASVSAAPASAPPPTVNDVAASPSVAFPSGNDGEPSDTSGSGCEPPLKRARNP